MYVLLPFYYKPNHTQSHTHNRTEPLNHTLTIAQNHKQS